MRVVIIGAGIGGLTLTQALRGAGIDACVYDRDTHLDDTGGYRLHLDPMACQTLARHLPPGLYQALLASSVGTSSFHRFGFLDHRLRVLWSKWQDHRQEALQIGRRPLRRLLAHGLDLDPTAPLRLGAEFTHAQAHRDGTVTAHFADGSADHADLLVGADGARSRVARSLAGRATARPTGAGGLVGRTPLTSRTRPYLPAALAHGPALALGPAGYSLFLAVQDPKASSDVAAEACVDVPADLEDGYLVWGINADHIRYPSDPTRLDTASLHRMAASMVESWPRPLQQLVAAADPDSITYFHFNAADPGTCLTPWSTGPVTALGDAVHAMPPTGGRGASTAIRDAGVLTQQLTSAADGNTTLTVATHIFEREMNAYASQAVRASLAPLTWQRRLHRAPLLYRSATAVVTTAQWLRHPSGTRRNGPHPDRRGIRPHTSPGVVKGLGETDVVSPSSTRAR